MKIDGNEIEIESLRAYRAGDTARSDELEDEFIRQFHESLKNKEKHCSCPKLHCKHHGRCIDCIALHRAHRDHLPNCLHDMVNERYRALVALTESELEPYRCTAETGE
ncbi:LPS biosynthesis protein [Ruminococcaceae bacterium OttesenSCG-928-D13]|nr:LPS biosynthesis protein [Ruminococcaceae bacterium OttesenSCG-928-D13]